MLGAKEAHLRNADRVSPVHQSGVSSGASRPLKRAEIHRTAWKTVALLELWKSQESSSVLDVLMASDPTTDLRVGGSNPSGRAKFPQECKLFSATLSK